MSIPTQTKTLAQVASEIKAAVALTKSDVGLANVDNTSDLAKPISTAVQAALDQKLDRDALANDIGIPGTAGFGVGICPNLPADFTPLVGSTIRGSDTYGNYIYKDGSIVVWVSKFYYRYGHASNPTYAAYGVNSCDIKGVYDYPSTAHANAAGYALHRAFIDGGVEQPGVFVDKYMASKQASGTGWIASSIKNGLPLSTASTHNPILDITAAGANAYYAAINAAKGRGEGNAVFNQASPWFCCSLPIYSALDMISLAHGQAATSTTYCAWYDGTGVTNYPKGCNNNALADVNDTAVKWASDGYPNCGKTGSAGYGGGAGNEFAKSTHNGQACGVADLNGLMYEVSIGMTCIGTSKAIAGISQTNPAVVTCVGHGRTTGDVVQIASVVGMTALNDRMYTVTVLTVDTLSLDGVDATALPAYTSGGSLLHGTFYIAKPSIRMRDFTSGQTLSTDHWGATGVANMMEPIAVPLRTDYPNNTISQRWGNGANQSLSPDLSGDGYRRTGFGLAASGGTSPGGTNLFGTDYFYEYYRDLLCPLVGAYWNASATAGVWARGFHGARSTSAIYDGFRCAYYL